MTILDQHEKEKLCTYESVKLTQVANNVGLSHIAAVMPSTEIVKRPIGERLREVAVLLLVGFCLTGLDVFRQLGHYGVVNWVVVSAIFLAFCVLALGSYIFRKETKQLTPEAAKLKPYYDAEALKPKAPIEQLPRTPEQIAFDAKLEKVLLSRVLRYPASALLLWASYSMAESSVKNSTLFSIILGLFALGFAGDLALWLICATCVVALVYFGFHLLAAVPVSIAVIFGALIIAKALKR